MNAAKDLKPFPELKSDEEAEEFVGRADLSEYDFSQFKPPHFEFGKKIAAGMASLRASRTTDGEAVFARIDAELIAEVRARIAEADAETAGDSNPDRAYPRARHPV
jgi:hypothetical protein